MCRMHVNHHCVHTITHSERLHKPEAHNTPCCMRTRRVPPSRDTFRVMLQRWQGERAKEQPPPGHEPQLGGVSWDPYAVFRAVAARGGWRHVSAAGLWREVGLEAEPRLAGCAPRALSRVRLVQGLVPPVVQLCSCHAPLRATFALG